MDRNARLDYNRRWYQAHKDKVREYREKTKDHRNARRRELYATCPEHRQKAINSAKVRCPAKRRAGRYGLTAEAVELMENDGCAICGAHPDLCPTVKLRIDHDHATGRVRGVLCHRCNVTLGHVKDDPILLSKTIRYLMESVQCETSG